MQAVTLPVVLENLKCVIKSEYGTTLPSSFLLLPSFHERILYFPLFFRYLRIRRVNSSELFQDIHAMFKFMVDAIQNGLAPPELRTELSILECFPFNGVWQQNERGEILNNVKVIHARLLPLSRFITDISKACPPIVYTPNDYFPLELQHFLRVDRQITAKKIIEGIRILKKEAQQNPLDTFQLEGVRRALTHLSELEWNKAKVCSKREEEGDGKRALLLPPLDSPLLREEEEDEGDQLIILENISSRYVGHPADPSLPRSPQRALVRGADRPFQDPRGPFEDSKEGSDIRWLLAAYPGYY
jgi:hypothetical protein